jgi:hypothetical protein
MTTAELVKKLMDAGANSDIVSICLTAIEEAAEDAKHPRLAVRRKKEAAAKRPEIVASRA